MRLLKRIGLIVLGVLAAACLALLLSGNVHILYGLRRTYLRGKKTPDIDDISYFDVRKIGKTESESTLVYSGYNEIMVSSQDRAWSDSMGTTAFLVYWRDSLVYEGYNESEATTLSNSFSMAKSITSILVGKAVEEGFIGSVDDKVGRYLAEYNTGSDTLLTIRHLLEMTSGIPFGESYNSPFGFMAKAYFGKHLEEATLNYHVAEKPGTKWAYEGGNTILLGMILKRATGMSVSDYCASRLWGPIGAENDAYWNLDHENGVEKTFSGFYATARDFARLGLLYMHKGVCGGDTIVGSDWVDQSLKPCNVRDVEGESCSWYGWQWWMGEHGDMPFFLMRGLRGQYVVCIPELDVVFVRLGHTQSKERINHMPADLYRYMDMAMSVATNK
jgi:CubicO group peptidase (beta-lactamase class C family)